MQRDATEQGIHFILDQNDKMKPCPFCGGTHLKLQNTWTASYWVECQTCGAQVGGLYREQARSVGAHEAAASSAIEKWNTRKELEPVNP